MPTSPYEPSWKKYEKDIHSTDIDTAQKATDAFLTEREKAVKSDKRARDWEESRKATVAKEKPGWVKEHQKAEQEPLKNMISSLKNAGSYDAGLIPSPGYIVVEEVKKDVKTEGGIYLSEEAQNAAINTGVVVSVCEGHWEFGKWVPTPQLVDKKVLFKWGAGLEIDLEGKKCRFMRLEDILGVFTK